MANERFDDLVKRIAESRLTRQEALRGLAGAAAAAAGAALASEETTAKKGRKVKAEKNGNQGKVTICHCPPGNPDNCHTISVGSKAVAAHLRNHPDDSEGECEEATTTTGEVTPTSPEVTTTTGEVTPTTAGIAAAGRRNRGRRRRRGMSRLGAGGLSGNACLDVGDRCDPTSMLCRRLPAAGGRFQRFTGPFQLRGP